jgi:hypothetical protein
MLLPSDVGSKTRGHLRGRAISSGHGFFLGGGTRECRLNKNFPNVGEPMTFRSGTSISLGRDWLMTRRSHIRNRFGQARR